RNYGWNVVGPFEEPDVAVERLNRGEAYLVIVDDCTETPATSSLRRLIVDPVSALTPTLCFLFSQKGASEDAIRTLGLPAIVQKPLTPAKFLPTFQSLVKTWENEVFSVMRTMAYQIMNNKEADCIEILTKLSTVPQAANLVTPALAMLLRQQGDLKE